LPPEDRVVGAQWPKKYFAERKIGVLITNGADAKALAALRAAAAARDFVTEAVAHCADPSGVDEGFVSLDDYPPAEFVARCRQVRHWDRQRAAVV
jgi:hypothetical protein